MATPFTSKNWGLWVQPEGPNTKTYYLGCHTLEDVESPGSGIKDIIRCFRADGTGWEVRGSTRNPPEAITTTVTGLIEPAASWLETIVEGANCPFPLYINGKLCPPYDVFGGAERWYTLESAEIGATGLSGLSHREEDNISEQRFDITAWPPLLRGHAVTTDRVAFTGTENLNGITSCSIPRCAGSCGDTIQACDFLVAVANGDPASADVWISTDHGETWTATATDPYLGTSNNLVSVVCFPIDAETTRILVARDLVATAPAAVYYSDDSGANWTEVLVGGVWAAGSSRNSLFALDMYHIWFITTTGMGNSYIWFSSDGGESWTMQEVIAGTLYSCWFADANNGMVVGTTDLIYVTTNGGISWSAATATGSGDQLESVAENAGGGIWWVGTNGGEMYYSTDIGATWTARTFPGSGAGTVTAITFITPTVGYMLHNPTNATGRVFRTRNGGFTWELVSQTYAGELYDIVACTVNEAFSVGEVNTTALVLKTHA